MSRNSTASGMLNDLKARLGFSRDDQGDSEGFSEDFNEYDDLDSDGYSPRYDSEYAGYGADYDENAQVGGLHAASTPKLVSIDDVKANTALPDFGSSPAQPSRRAGSRNLIDDRAPAQSSPAYNASLRDRGSNARSEGLNSLFEPSGGVPQYGSPSVGGAVGDSRSRGMSVIRPSSYNDAERVARALKAGDVVVLAMRATPQNLLQRVLDFSFGAASALDANVECPGDKVFAIARGAGLTESEKRSLRSQGVL